ncbi:glycosyltransferase family protein [Candidatus Enterovibrio escicola]|uniref:glycosyltransferase family 1 protein n=1 Tax=Candidatus Enterovibrio escicola TaxID=1927127 RepID=UPI001237BC79|nr:glycosyltransferase family 1 protein [Candidatus Enterovibrio escacola]
MSRDLIVFGEDWGGLPSSTQHLIRHLAVKRKIIWINSIGLRQPHLSVHDIMRVLKKLSAKTICNKPAQEKLALHNITIVNPITLPAPRTCFSRALASNWLSRQLLPIIKRAKLRDPIMWTSLPTAVDVADKLGTTSLVYYCCDDFSSLAGVDHNTVVRREAELVEKADLILASSETLVSRFPHQRTKFLPHGVDYTLFSIPVLRAPDLPDNQRPIAGFYGSLSEWLDYNLLDTIISVLPYWDFVFIGSACKRALLLKSYSNVTLLAHRPHHLLPSYSQHWTVSMLPFTSNAQIKSCNPLKLREYLATGTPIISTPFPAITSYSSFVSIVQTAYEMVSALEQVRFQQIHEKRYESCNRLRRKQQQNAVKLHTWESRAKDLERWLDAL